MEEKKSLILFRSSSLIRASNSLSVVEKIISKKPKTDDWVKFYDNGLMKYKAQDYKGAIEDFSKSIELSVNYYIPVEETELALHYLGLAKYQIQDYNGAIECFTNAIWHGERYGSAMYDHRDEPKSIILLKNEKEDFTQNSILLPYANFANSYYNRGVIKRLLNDEQGAESDFERAKRIQTYANRSNL